MKFWDTSALVPLMTIEDRTNHMRVLIGSDRNVIVSFITPVELTSAMWAKGRRWYDEDAFQRSLWRIEQFEANWTLVDDLAPIMKIARQLVTAHVLRAGDAIQLAAACFFADKYPEDLPFVTLDNDLARAARAEGFPVLPN